NFYDPVVSDLNGLGKRSAEWDVNDWRWDGDFFRAVPLNAVPSDCRSRQFFPEIPLRSGLQNTFSLVPIDEGVLKDEREKRDSEKRRRYIDVNEEDNEETGSSLNLKLGVQALAVIDSDGDKAENSAKKCKVSGAQSSSSRAACQVEDCKADLTNTKDYYRRHKVCDVHSKSANALVGGILQRFCQQCSRFHVLEEFDEGKRSCRRRLAGHNKRRRKAHPESAVGSNVINDEHGNNDLLITLLRLLSNIQTSGSDQPKDQDLLSNLLKNLANLASSSNATNPRGSLPVSPDLHKAGASFETDGKGTMSPGGSSPALPSTSLTQKSAHTENALAGPGLDASPSCVSSPATRPDASMGRERMNNIDLNSAYDDSEDLMDNVPDILGNASPSSFKDSQRSSPPQLSGNSGSTQSQSPSTLSGEVQIRTDRIVLKLFGKDPSDFPLTLRKQIFDWLSSSPTDIESYIRPGCVILTIYTCMDKENWAELHCNLNSSLRRLIDSSADPFWRTGWIYTRVQHQASFVYNGQVVTDMPIPMATHRSCRISSIAPLAVSFSEEVHFTVKGVNLAGTTSRVLCALEGRYLLQENCDDVVRDDCFSDCEEIQCLEFSCSVPNVVGRGFIEVEDYCINSSFFPFIVAEKEVCSEICKLEAVIEDAADSEHLDTYKTEARNRALEFVNEMGWLLHKNNLMLRWGETRGEDVVDLFPFIRFKYLMDFAIDRDWPSVVRKLLKVVFDGSVEAGQYTSPVAALLDIGVLHRAVRKNSRPMVEFLLSYRSPDCGKFLFRPDGSGPGGLTPLHIAAGLDGCDDVVDALTEDPELVGIGAWKNCRDSAGFSPQDYASLRGHYSYIHLVQRKLNKRSGQVVVDIPDKQKVLGGAMQVEKNVKSCSECARKMHWSYGRARSSVAIFRPAMVSMVAIAAVCVCAALLWRTLPGIFHSWDQLKY
ncbi:hypothetical protein M569_11157, partial [Genlisea aurea]